MAPGGARPQGTAALEWHGLNASWSPLFFGPHRPKVSAAVSGALVPTIAAYALTVRKTDKLAAALMLL